MAAAKPLTNLQLELLQAFNFDIDDKQLLEIRQLLIDYFANKVTEDMDKLFDQNEWGDEKIDEWANEHMRTPYKNDI